MKRLIELRKYKEEIEQVCKQFGAKHIRVFGSVALGQERPSSDIDFLVELPKGYDMFAQRLPLQQRLMEITGSEIDVIPEHELSPYLRDRILEEAISL